MKEFIQYVRATVIAHGFMRGLLLALLLGLLPGLSVGAIAAPSPLPAQASTAQSLFGDLQRMVFQIRVIDIGSGDKFSLGSGFQVSARGHIATNFHVVSAYVNEPDKYRLEFVTSTGVTEPALLRVIDVVHDLAILQSDNLAPQFMPLGIAPLKKGGRIYSIGNPLDLGMTIIEGTYNGLVKRSRYQKILFSGSLNSGMSGGPTVSEDGKVIGVNVSKGGEQISFLVPVARLRTLLASITADATPINFKVAIHAALQRDQDSFFESLLAKPLVRKKLGELSIPGDIHESLRCWGHSEDTDKIRYSAIHQHCRSDDNIFLGDELIVGSFNYDAEWISTSELNRLQFYKFVESRFTHTELGVTDSEKHYTEYACHTDFVSIAGLAWKASSCFRAYKDFAGLYDALFLMALVESNRKSAIIKIGASAISQANATTLFKSIMESVQWIR